MNVVNVKNNEITVIFSKEELGFISSAINEAIEALSDGDFSIRTGYTEEEAENFLEFIHESYKLIP